MMYMLYFILITLVVMMAKKPRRRRRMGRYVKGNIAENIALGTLAGNDLILSATDTVNERTLVSSVVATYSLAGLTPTENAGPILIGVAHSDYSDAEVEAWVELQTGWDEGDLGSREIQNRFIRRIGLFDEPATANLGVSLNEGKAIKTKLNWILLQGQGLNFFCYNTGGAALATTDPNVHVQGHANLWPR